MRAFPSRDPVYRTMAVPVSSCRAPMIVVFLTPVARCLPPQGPSDKKGYAVVCPPALPRLDF